MIGCRLVATIARWSWPSTAGDRGHDFRSDQITIALDRGHDHTTIWPWSHGYRASIVDLLFYVEVAIRWRSHDHFTIASLMKIQRSRSFHVSLGKPSMCPRIFTVSRSHDGSRPFNVGWFPIAKPRVFHQQRHLNLIKHTFSISDRVDSGPRDRRMRSPLTPPAMPPHVLQR